MSALLTAGNVPCGVWTATVRTVAVTAETLGTVTVTVIVGIVLIHVVIQYK